MSEFQKFQFDNFVIDGDVLSTPKKTEEIPVVEPEIVEEVIPAVPEEQELPEETPPPIVEIVPEVIEEVKTYTEDEVAEFSAQAEQKGYENGFNAAKEGIEAQNARLLEEINTRLMMLATGADERKCEQENQMLDILKAALHKVVPELAAEKSKEIVNNFLNENFAQFKDEERLAFYFNPQTLPYVQENIARLANIHDFEGKISLHKDAQMKPADCRVEWENGGVERNSNKMLEKIDKTLEDAKRKI